MRWLWILAIILVIVPFAAATELADYGTVTSYYYNITTGMGTQTDYQVKFILSNSSGVSGYYAPYNIIYTNGTTRADWYDINATDASNTPLKFWVENNTATAYNITAWVKVPSIATGNTSTGKWYYGNASQSASTMDGLNTFPMWDDFLESSFNSTKWPYTSASGGVLTQSGGEINITASGFANYGINTSLFLGGNYSVRTRVKQPATGSTILLNVGWRGIADAARVVTRLNVGNIALLTNAGSDSLTNVSTTGTTFNVINLKRNSTSSAIISINDTVTSQTFTQVPTGDLPQSIYSYSTGAVTIDDWIFVAKTVWVEPTTSLYSTTSGAGAPDIVASFTDVPDPSTTGETATFTDTSTGSPTTWNWTFGDGNTSTTQNPTYAFPDAGSFWVDLNVTNSTGSFSNYTALHTVVNVSGFTPQDVWMEGQYNITVHVTDSSTGAQLGNVTISTSDGQSATTNSLGYAYITEAFGVYVFYFSKEGYSSKSVSVAVDEDDTLDVQMTEAASTNNQQNTWYTPHQVRFRVFDGNNAPVVGTAVCATAISSTFPSGSDISWLTDMYGINPDMANEMLNGTLIMSGTTQSDGSTVFTMHSSIGYDIDVTNPANGVVQSVNVTPIDNYYVIHLVGSAVNNTYMQMGYNTTLNVTEPNTSYVTMHVFYQDMSGMTSLAEMYVVDRSNNTVINYQSTVPVGSNWVWMNYTVPNVRGQRYSWYYNGVRTI